MATHDAGPRGASAKDRAVVQLLVDHHRAFLSFLERRVGDRATAEDILQEAFVKGLGQASSLRDEESAVAWFYRLLRNAVIDRRRREGTKGRALDAFAAELSTLSAAAGDTEATICACVGRLASTLKPEYAEAIRRVEIDGVAVKDYASEAGITKGNAAVRVFRARQALREQVIRSCGTCATHGCFDCRCRGVPLGEP